MSSIYLIVSSLKKGHKTTFISRGDSMFPLIPNNTKTIITPKKFSEIKIYDIVAVKSQNKIIIHQCLFKNSQYLVCQGVNNHFVDPPASPKQILGTVDIGNYWKIINLNYDFELQKIHQLIPKVPILILKGASWQKKFYGHYLNKSVSDIDILIKKSNFANLKKALEILDYHQLPSSTPSNEISFVKKTSTQSLTIDVHFRAIRSALNPLFRHPLEAKNMTKLTSEFWKSSSSQKDNLHFLKSEHLLLYFCLNSLFHHGLRGTDILATISFIATTEKINWQNFWDLVKKYHFTNFVYYPLGWSSRLFKTKVPNLKHHRPNIFRRLLTKSLINQYTVFRPFHNLSKDYLSSRINVILIFIIRLFLYER